MSARVTRANRVAEAVVGLVLLLAGGFGLAVSFGALGDSTGPLLPQGMRDYAADQPWFWWAVAAGCLVLALLGLRWLLAQLHSDKVSRVDLTTDDRDGLTSVHAGALTDAVETEVRAIRGVTGATANLHDRRGRRLLLTVDLADYADLAEVRHTLETRVVAHTRQAIDDPDLPCDIELRPGAARSGSRGLT